MAQPIGVILQQWADLDIFFYALPFLLIFSLIFAILQKVKIMGDTAEHNKGVSAIIAVSVALMSLQFDQVPRFFQIIFPQLGIALSVLLVGIILLGLFVNYEKHEGAAYIFLAIGGAGAILVVLNSFAEYSWWTGSFWADNFSAIIAGIIIVVFVLVVINSGKRHTTDASWMFRPIK
jgi:hypothetical protein